MRNKKEIKTESMKTSNENVANARLQLYYSYIVVALTLKLKVIASLVFARSCNPDNFPAGGFDIFVRSEGEFHRVSIDPADPSALCITRLIYN